MVLNSPVTETSSGANALFLISFSASLVAESPRRSEEDHSDLLPLAQTGCPWRFMALQIITHRYITREINRLSCYLETTLHKERMTSYPQLSPPRIQHERLGTAQGALEALA